MLALTWQGKNSVVMKSMPVPHLVDPTDAQPKKRRAVEDDDNDDEEELDPDEEERRIADLSDNDDEDDDVGGRRKKQKRARNKYLDIEAEVDDSDEEIEDEEEGFDPDDGFIDEEDIYDTAASCIRAAADNANLDRMRRQTENQTAEEWAHNAEEMARNFRKKYRRIAGRKDIGTSDDVPRHALMPDLEDPSLWAVSVKIGRERQIVMTIMRKACASLQGIKGQAPAPMAIHSAFCRDSIPGKIYVESRRRESVIEALAGIVGVYARTADKLLLVPIEEMADLLKFTKIEHELKVGAWVRFKQGHHTGDLAQVIEVGENGEKVGIKFVPRIDMNPSEQDDTEDKRAVKRQRNLGRGKNAINKRPHPQRFVPTEVQRVYPGEVAKRGKDIYRFHKEEYRNGFCEKDVSVTSLVVEDVQPTLQEIELFQGVTAEVDDEGNAIESVNLLQLAKLKRKANEVVVQPGDHVEVFAGEQRGVRGTVDAINGQVIIISMEHAEMDGTKVEVQLDQVRKTWKPGDHVKVGFGDHTDEAGMVVQFAGEKTIFLSDLTKKEVTVFSNDLRQAARAGFSQISIADADNNMEKFQVHDLVMYKNQPAVIFDSESEGFWILDEQGDTHLVPPRSLLQSKNNLGVCIDREGHEFRKGDTMKETVGDSPRNGKVVQTHPAGVVFLFNQDISENNGVWYASPSRLTPLTPHHIGTSVKDSLDKMNPARNMQLMASRGNGPTPTPHVALSGRTKDYLKGRHVVVVKGPFKSYRGIIKETLADDKAYVELHTTNRNETFPLALLKEKDPDTGQSKPLAIGGGPGANSGPAQVKSNMRTLYSSGSNGIMGPTIVMDKTIK